MSTGLWTDDYHSWHKTSDPVVEMDGDLGFDQGETPPVGTGNQRNGSSADTVRTEIGDVRLAVPRDRAGIFDAADRSDLGTDRAWRTGWVVSRAQSDPGTTDPCAGSGGYFDQWRFVASAYA